MATLTGVLLGFVVLGFETTSVLRIPRSICENVNSQDHLPPGSDFTGPTLPHPSKPNLNLYALFQEAFIDISLL